MGFLEFFFFVYLPQASLVPLWLLGILLAVRYWRCHPRVSLAAGLSLFVILVVTPQEASFQPTREVVSTAITFVTMAAWLLLLAAVFGWRMSESGPDARTLIRGGVIGAFCGGLLMTVLWAEAPFYLAFFGTVGTMIAFGIGWGILAGVAVAITGGMIRGAILGAAAAFVLMLFTAGSREPDEAGPILQYVPVAVVIGAFVGAGLARSYRLFHKKGKQGRV